MTWHDISTAPKDGTRVLLAYGVRDPALVEAGIWHGDYGGWWEVNTHPTDYIDGQILHPFAWQPYPLPPSPPQ